MKITIKQISESIVEMEVPKYWKDNLGGYFMLLSDNAYIQAYDCGYDPKLGLCPFIRTYRIDYLRFDLKKERFNEISEVDFKLAYFKVSNQIEKLLR